MIICIMCLYIIYLIITRIIKTILNKNERRCRDVKTQKVREQGWKINVGYKNNLHINLHKYLHCYKAKYKAYFLGFDVSTIILNGFYYSCFHYYFF